MSQEHVWLQGDVMAMLVHKSASGPGQLSLPEAIKQAVSQMDDPASVAWAPRFAAALVANTEAKPRARTTVQAVCLDMWEGHMHWYAFHPHQGLLATARDCDTSTQLLLFLPQM